MATIRSPNRDFTLGVPASQITMSSPSSFPSIPIAVPNTIARPQPTPQASVLADIGGPMSFPIAG